MTEGIPAAMSTQTARCGVCGSVGIPNRLSNEGKWVHRKLFLLDDGSVVHRAFRHPFVLPTPRTVGSFERSK